MARELLHPSPHSRRTAANHLIHTATSPLNVSAPSAGVAGDFAGRICGSPGEEGTAHRPRNSCNYVAAHDGFSLADLVAYTKKNNSSNGEDNRDGEEENISWNCGGENVRNRSLCRHTLTSLPLPVTNVDPNCVGLTFNSDSGVLPRAGCCAQDEGPSNNADVRELRRRQKRNFMAALLLSQGVPTLHMGDEYGHSKGGNNNSYCHDSPLNYFLWDEADLDEEGAPRKPTGRILIEYSPLIDPQ